ncbi:MAG TPA: hypothetical protein VIM73_22840 [Polyangiaceae bacterium]
MAETESKPNSRDPARRSAVQEQEKPPKEGHPDVPHGRGESGGRTLDPKAVEEMVEQAHRVPSGPI